MFTELKETMSKELKENVRMMSYQRDNINKQKFQKIETLELKSTKSEMKKFSRGAQKQRI